MRLYRVSGGGNAPLIPPHIQVLFFFYKRGVFLNFLFRCTVFNTAVICRPSDSTVSEDAGYCAVNLQSNELTRGTTELVQYLRLYRGSSHRRKSSFGRCVPWTTRHLSDTSFGRYIPKTSHHWPMCPDL